MSVHVSAPVYVSACVFVTALGPWFVRQINHLHALLTSARTWEVGVEARRGTWEKRDVVKATEEKSMEVVITI